MKRVADLTDDECVIVFEKLSRAKKKQLLEVAFPSLEVFVYQESRTFRDVLTLIAVFVDLPTFFRLKQCCRVFRDTLCTPRVARRIQHYMVDPTEELSAPVSEMRDSFEFYVRRLIHLLQLSKSAMPFTVDPMFNDPPETANSHLVKHESIPRFMATVQSSSSRRWFVVENVCRISYPHGLICKDDGPVIPRGHIFDDNVLDCFTLDATRSRWNGGVHIKHARTMSKSDRERSKVYAALLK